MESTAASENWAYSEGILRPIDKGLQYVGPHEGAQHPYGIALSSHRNRSGKIQATVTFERELESASAGLLFGFNVTSRQYYSAGIGGWGHQFTISENIPNRGWVGRAASGSMANVSSNVPYQISVFFKGQQVLLDFSGVRVLEYTFPSPLTGDQIGLTAWGTGPVKFEDFKVEPGKTDVFIVMQFGEPFDGLYTDVIAPVVTEFPLNAYRADDIYTQGIILQDITSGIAESEVIIAEISSLNPNVFYEVCYAHVLHKPAILLVQRGVKLPFDISGYRCIFYDDTIKGKSDVEKKLRKHLRSILDVDDL